ncbi:hypothetical protein AJ78_06538 [Emergomyces pasteurianus Ep9510]|uniref:Uncharacterized protein n=1 Tax=Emergomyces pasteurianus Ep9510 TaxID=1447872 RepID=A0A1J9PA58_9EURO|nr:hypothetical protein AJ78_06538 [Emergomyces pasteurianus Ep9510]
MCWQMRKTPARFPDCTGKAQGNCINFDPTEDYVKWCDPARARNSQCEHLTPTSQASSTKRRVNCPRHRAIAQPPPKKDDEGAAGGGNALAQQQHGIKVGA